MKPIKFDLRLKEVKITNFEELQDNFCAEILPIYQSGRLAKWFKSREMSEQALAIDTIDKNVSEMQQLKGICQVLGLEADEEELQYMLDDRQTFNGETVIPALDETQVKSDEECSISFISEDNEEITENIPNIEEEVKSFDSILGEFYSQLNDKSSFYCGRDIPHRDEKIKKKIHNAEVTYAHADRYVDEGEIDKLCSTRGWLFLFVDLTIFGSGKEGFYITTTDLYAKSLHGERFHIELKDISDVRLDEDKCELTFNEYKFCIAYTNNDLTNKMRILVDCLNEYVAQFQPQSN